MTFGVLAFAWYELSGGASFVAVERPALQARAAEPKPAPVQTARLDLPAKPKPVIAPVAVSRPAAVVPIAKPEPQAEVIAASLTVEAPAPTVAEPRAEEPRPVLLISRPEQTVNPEDEVFRDLRQVTGARVNLRNGPGTGYGVVGKLYEGDTVAVIGDAADGWLKVETEDRTQIGWMADWLVTAAN
ncbi:MAG: SH3 domain-containing protein [Roseivivax sp.]|nr:SH3 domain-containing protein [Roseivivax sp.]